VLILHGFLEQGAAWHEVATRLSRRVIAPDHRGHGQSGHVLPGGFYHFWNYVSDVDGIIDVLGGNVDLVGHSMGGTIASLIAACRPDKIRRLVLVEGLGPPDLRGHAVERARAFLDHLAEPRRHPAFTNVAAAAQRMRQYNPRLSEWNAMRLATRITRPVREDDTDVLPPIRDGYVTWTWDPQHRGRTPNPFDADLHKMFLAEIRAPTLLIDGGASRFRLSPEDHAKRVAAIANHESHVVPNAGHLVHHDAPEALADAIGRFLDA
jgi:pimeloyl-ACP methyl ester carboxylesterase